MKIPFLLILSAMVFCFSCKNKPPKDHLVLKISLDEKTVSVSDLFQKVELIPLTTSDESLFTDINKLIVHDSTIFIFDERLYGLFQFDLDGQFRNKIHRVGRGPQEYLMAYDFVVNPEHGTVLLLNPMGWIHEYDFSGTFVQKYNLPNPPTGYRYFEITDQDHYVTWTTEYEKDRGGVNILDKEKFKIDRSYFPYSSQWGGLHNGSVFHRYKNEVYYHESLAGQVYRITADGYQTAYEWDLGVRLIDPRKLKVREDVLNEARRALINDFREGTIPFFYGRQFETDRYYYASLIFSGGIRKAMYYDKSTGESGLFHKTTEGIVFDIRYMTEEYALGVMTYDDRESFRNIVSVDDARILDTMKEDDNVWLVKFTFKD